MGPKLTRSSEDTPGQGYCWHTPQHLGGRPLVQRVDCVAVCVTHVQNTQTLNAGRTARKEGRTDTKASNGKDAGLVGPCARSPGCLCLPSI
eukprot:1178916-Pyramimonas_sp.AAC.1